jgi:hypothetical protein
MIMTAIIIAFFVGSTTGVVVAMFMAAAIHGRQKEDWQAEYRRLMGGIKAGAMDVLNVNQKRCDISDSLHSVYDGGNYHVR